MTHPYAGAPCHRYTSTCLYGITQDAPSCDRAATRHILADDTTYGMITMSACDEHADMARQVGRYIAEHDHAFVCGLPVTVWLMPDNVCVIDDSGVEPDCAATRPRERTPELVAA